MFAKCTCKLVILQFHFREGNASQKIWLSGFTDDCSLSYGTCLTECEWCPASRVTSCSHYQDIKLECGEGFSRKAST